MPAAGDPVYASDVLRARPTILDDASSGSFGASQTDVDIPGISISFTTETDGATVAATWFIQADLSGASTATLSARARITGPSAYATAAALFATYAGEVATDASTVGQQYTFTLGDAGLYTATLRGTTNANQTINIYTSLRCIIQEQWS